MTTHISALNIDSYRGINHLSIDNLGGVNIFLGDNNVGKTSILEAIELLCNPTEYGLVQVARQRENGRYLLRSRLGIVESVLFLFDINSEDKSENKYSMKLGGTIHEQTGTVDINAEVVQKLIDLNNLSEYDRREKNGRGMDAQEETRAVVGTINSSFLPLDQLSFSDLEHSIKFDLDNYSRIYRINKTGKLMDVNMVHTIDHLMGDTLSGLLRKKKSKDRAIELLKEFEESICDIRYINEESGPRYYPVIENNNHDYIPLSLYGDGMKKILTVLNALVETENGVVLIDEYETALHTTSMEKVFRFIMDISKELNIQLFLTTHSSEAVDKLLECAADDLNEIRVIRLKKKNNRTYARVTDGKEALFERKEYNMEFRV